MVTLGRVSDRLFRDFPNLKYAIPPHDTLSTVFRMLDVAFGKVLAELAALLRDEDVISADGKALRGARQVRKRAHAYDGVSLCSAASSDIGQPGANNSTELDAALEVGQIDATREFDGRTISEPRAFAPSWLLSAEVLPATVRARWEIDVWFREDAVRTCEDNAPSQHRHPPPPRTGRRSADTSEDSFSMKLQRAGRDEAVLRIILIGLESD